jgi:hypothetical protein
LSVIVSFEPAPFAPIPTLAVEEDKPIPAVPLGTKSVCEKVLKEKAAKAKKNKVLSLRFITLLLI